ECRLVKSEVVDICHEVLEYDPENYESKGFKYDLSMWRLNPLACIGDRVQISGLFFKVLFCANVALNQAVLVASHNVTVLLSRV
ncbi:hypothetical protein L195_g038295, partial [Trifolium pratense]